MAKHTRRAARLLIIAVATLWWAAVSAQASIYSTDAGNGTIGKYNDDGSTANASLVTGLSNPISLALSGDGSSLFVNDLFAGSVGQYDATTGTEIDATLISGLTAPGFVAVSGDNLFVADSSAGTVGKYTTSGATINASLVSGLSQPRALAVSDDGNTLFLAEQAQGAIKVYDANTGATLNDALVPGLGGPWGIALSADGTSIYVSETALNRIGQYSVATGAAINAELISGLSQPNSIALSGPNLFVANAGNGAVGKYTTSGVIVNAAFISGIGNNFSGIAVRKDLLAGDFDGDLDIDGADYLVLSMNLLTDVTALTTQQSRLLGDLTADLRIDGRDFVAFRTAYDEANGVGSFVAMLQEVPEPSTWALGSVALLALTWIRRRA